MKKNRFLLLIILLLCIGVSKVSAKTKYICYYDDQGYITDENSGTYWTSFNTYQEAGGTFTNCNGKRMNMEHTYIKMTVSDDYSVSFKYVDAGSNIESKKICFEGDELAKGYMFFSENSGYQLNSSDFSAGCPRFLDRLRLKDVIDGDSEGWQMYYDVIKKGSDEYTWMYEKNTDEVDIWDGRGTNSYPCYDSSSPAQADDTNTQNVEMCAKVAKQVLADSKELDYALYCSYVEPDFVDDEGKIYAQASFGFNKSDGKYIENTGVYKYSTDGTASPNFSLSKVDNNYVCPEAIYDCSSSHNSKSLVTGECDGGKKMLLIKTKYLNPSDSDDTSGCATYEGIGKYISGAYTLIRYLIPTLIVMLSTADFVGVVFSGEQDKMEKAKYKFMMRLIIGVVALLIPFLLELMLKLAGILGSGDSLADAVCNLL